MLRNRRFLQERWNKQLSSSQLTFEMIFANTYVCTPVHSSAKYNLCLAGNCIFYTLTADTPTERTFFLVPCCPLRRSFTITLKWFATYRNKFNLSSGTCQRVTISVLMNFIRETALKCTNLSPMVCFIPKIRLRMGNGKRVDGSEGRKSWRNKDINTFFFDVRIFVSLSKIVLRVVQFCEVKWKSHYR